MVEGSRTESPFDELRYLRSVIATAARHLRAEDMAVELVAYDLESSLAWSRLPAECDHPYLSLTSNGAEVCRTCKTPVGDDYDPMGR